MAQVRRTMRLVLDGEKFEVTTNAMDLINAERDGAGPVQQGLRTAHQALIRTRQNVPARFETFAAKLDSFDDITDDGEEDAGDLDPTQSADSETSQ